MTKAIVTGGAGFVGSHMVDLLIKKKYKVIVIDNFSGGHRKNLAHLKKNKNLIIKNIDINNLKTSDELYIKAKYIFHFAGIGDIVPSIVQPERYMLTNLYGTIKVLELARKLKVKKLVYAASASCYGKTIKIVNENAPINIEHPYGLSKFLGEQSVLHWNKVYNLPVNCIRIFNAYGPRVRTTGSYGAVIGVFFKQKLSNKPLTVVGDGKQTRDFVHVKDVAKAFYLAAKTKYNGYCFNVGSSRSISVNKLVSLIGGKSVKIPDRPGEPRHSLADTRLIRSKLGWKPQITFEDGINEMLININDWKKAPLWTKNKISKATKLWFKYLKG